MLDFSEIGKALRRLRLHRDLRQADLAAAAGITAPMLSAYETGKQRPSFATLDKLIAALNCDAADLSRSLLAVALEEDSRPYGDDSSAPTPQPRARAAGSVREVVGLEPRSRLSSGEQQHLSTLLPGLLELMRRLKS